MIGVMGYILTIPQRIVGRSAILDCGFQFGRLSVVELGEDEMLLSLIPGV